MDAPRQRDGALLRGIVSKGSNLAARSVRRSDQERGNYRLVRLLRWTDLTAHGSSCAFYGLGRVLSDNTASHRDRPPISTRTRATYPFRESHAAAIYAPHRCSCADARP